MNSKTLTVVYRESLLEMMKFKNIRYSVNLATKTQRSKSDIVSANIK